MNVKKAIIFQKQPLKHTTFRQTSMDSYKYNAHVIYFYLYVIGMCYVIIEQCRELMD